MARLEYFCSLQLATDTLYFTSAEESTIIPVGGVDTLFVSCLADLRFDAGFESAAIGRELPGTASLTLTNVDIGEGVGWLDKFLGFGAASQFWGNRKLTIKYGSGDFDNMSVENVYRLRRGTLRHSASEVSFQAQDVRQAHDLPLLSDRFTAGAEQAAIGRFVPLVYGDFTTLPGPESGGIEIGHLRAFCSDTSSYTFKVASHAIGSLAVYYYESDAETWTLLNTTTHYTDDAGNGGFILKSAWVASQFPNWPDELSEDRFTVKCTGVSTTKAITGGSGVLDKSVDIMYDLLVTRGGASASDVDATGFATAYAESDGWNLRTSIDQQTGVMEAVSQILKENNLSMYVADGLYKLRFFEPNDEIVADVTPSELAAGSGEPESVYDPDGLYMNRVIARASPDHSGSLEATHYVAITVDDSSGQSEYGSAVEVEWDLQWVYTLSNVTRACQRQLFWRSSTNHNVKFVVAPGDIDAADYLWRLNLSDVVSLSDDWQFDNSLVEIRRISRDATRGTMNIDALVIGQAFPVARWSSGSTLSDTPARWSEGSALSSQPAKWA